MRFDEQRVHTVLVIGDDPEWVRLLTRAIGSQYPVVYVLTGEYLLRTVRSLRPSVIVMGVGKLGGKAGFTYLPSNFVTFITILVDLQKDPEIRGIPALMLMDVNRTTKRALGADAVAGHLGEAPLCFMEEPISTKRLLEGIEMLIANGNAREWELLKPSYADENRIARDTAGG